MQSEAGSLLIEGGLVTESQLQQALSASVRSGGSLVQNLVRLGLLADVQLAAFFASRLQIPLAEQAQFDSLPAFITRLVPTDVVMTHRTVPLMLHQGVLHVAMSDPTDRSALEEISFITGYAASPVAAPDPLVEAAMARYYGIPPDDALPELDSLPEPEQDTQAGRYSVISRPWNPAGAGDSRPPSGTFDQAPPTAQSEADAGALEPEPPNPTLSPSVQPASPPADEDPPSLATPPVVADRPRASPPRAAAVVEPATGELAELFGLGQGDPEVIELTKPKQTTAATSITDAIRLQVDLETGLGASGEGPAASMPKEVDGNEPPGLWDAPVAGGVQVAGASDSADGERTAGPLQEMALQYPSESDIGQQEESAHEPAFDTDPSGPSPSPVDPGDGEGSIQTEQTQADPSGEILLPLRDADEARNLIAQASDRDEVARALVRYAHAFMPRVALFIVKKDILVGWLGAGPGISMRQVKGIMIPLSSPSVFRTVRETGTDYFGTLPRTTVNDIFLAALGDLRPRQALLIPVTVRHKPICILYGDCGPQPGFTLDLSGIHLISQDASSAFEQLILQRKMNRLVNR